MTDTTAGRGGVGIRLYTTGGEVVKRNFDQVGDSGRKMWAEIATGNQKANPALRALSAGVGEARNGVDALAGRAGPAGTVLANFGAQGVAAAAGLGGLAVALVKTREAMEFAATLTDTADRIGTGVEELQAFRFIADEAGVSTDAFESNLERLNNTLGAFKSGVGDGRVKPVFEALGITPEQLANVQSADQLMLILADTLGQVQDRAVQVRFAKALGIEESLPILRLGSDRIAELSAEAERLGLVMGEDVVAGLDAADRQMEIAQQRIDASLRLAVSGLADDFADLVTAVAGAVGWLVRFDAQVKALSGGGGDRSPTRGVLGIVGDTVRGRTAAQGNAVRDAELMEETNNPIRRFGRWLGIGAQRREFLQAQERESAQLRSELSQLATGTGIHADRTPGWERVERAGGRSSGRSGGADRSARDGERVLEQLARELERSNKDVIQAQGRLAETAEDRADNALGMVRLDKNEMDAKAEALRAELARLGLLDQTTQAQLDELAIMQNQATTLRENQIVQEERKEIAERQLRRYEAQQSDAIALLEIEADLADTERERYEVARRILQHEQALERRRLEAALREDPALNAFDRAGRMAAFDLRSMGEVRVLDADENNRLREQFKSYGREVADAIKDGRLGEYIGDKLKERMLDGALESLFAMLSRAGQGGGGGGGFWASVASTVGSFLQGGGRAGGGDVKAGFQYRMAEHGDPELLMLGGQGQVANKAQVAEMVRSMWSPDGRPATSAASPIINMPPIHIDATGADAAGLARVERAVLDLNRSLEERALKAVFEYRGRSHGVG